MTADPSREWLRPSEVADAFGVPVLRVQRWLKAGSLPGRKIGGLWFVHRSEVEGAYHADREEPQRGRSNPKPLPSLEQEQRCSTS